MGLFDDDEVIELFEMGEILEYGDLAERLDVDLQTAVMICGRLEGRGIIEAMPQAVKIPRNPRPVVDAPIIKW